MFPDDDDEDARKSAPVDEWDKNFLKVDQEMLYEIILAANYLNIRPLLDSGCKIVAEMIRGKSPEELRRTFNIVNDFSPEEEAAIKRENEWTKTVRYNYCYYSVIYVYLCYTFYIVFLI